MRNVVFTADAWASYVYWQTQDRRTLRRINELIKAIQREPFTGIGKPEPLVGDLSGLWSRRIGDTHRLVYEASAKVTNIVSCRNHY